MKRNHLLAVLLLFIASTLRAQPKSALDSLKEQYEKYPQQALREAEKIRTEALRRNDKALFLEALFLKIHFTLQIDSDQYPAVIEEVKQCVADEQELSARSILHACLAQLYQEYYDRNRYKIAQRTALEGDLPESIEEWSPNLFEQHIFEELTASIAPAEALQATPINRYRAIYAISPATDTLRPTLYDHLCHEAIEAMPPAFNQVPDSIAMQPALLGNAEAFLSIALPETGAPERLRIWQQLLRFRSTAGNAAAFVLADLERLDNTHHIYNGEDRDTLYLNTLEEMRKAYAHLPISVEIIAQEAEWLSRHLHDGNALANNERALALCEEGIRKFPKYPRINRLHTIITNIKQPGITVRFPQTIYPGEAFDLHINSRNLTGFTLDIYRINATIEAFQAIPYADRQQLPRTLVRQKSYQLPSSLIPQDTT
ncbi:MAG: hypothetical protein K2O69_03060, partial [Odoribacter sp.]|nr:hypothetical protein [Odoribacter sp.]